MKFSFRENKEHLVNYSRDLWHRQPLFRINWPARLKNLFFWPYALIPLLALGLIIMQAQTSKREIKTTGLVESAAVAANKNDSNLDVTALPRLKQDAPPLPSIVSARSYLVYDQDDNKVLLSKNPNEQLPIASLTKLTTALLVAKTLRPDQPVIVKSSDIADLPSPTLKLEEGEILSVKSLLEAMLVSSANDAAQLLATQAGDGSLTKGVAEMNSLAYTLELKNTHYANPTGLDETGAYSSAADLLKIIQEINRNPYLVKLMSETGGQISSLDGLRIHKFQTTNRLLRNGQDYITGGKTGYTDSALGNLAVFVKAPNGSQLIAISLGSIDRESDMDALLRWLFNSYSF